MSRVLITGASGFTGQHMAAELATHGYTAIGLLAYPSDKASDLFNETVVADLLDREALARAVAQARPDFVVHLAGVAFVAHGDADAIYRVNLVGSRNLLEALAQLPIKPQMTLMASSANVYGNAGTEVLNEEVPLAPANDYAVSKLAMEYVARPYADRMPIVVARPFNYTGVGQSTLFLIPKIVDHIRNGADTVELGNLDVSRDFSDVRMVASAYRKLLACPTAAGATVNVCSGQAYSLRQVVELASALAGRAMKMQVNPAFVRANEVRILRGDRRRLESLVGPVPPIALRDTLAWMLDQAGTQRQAYQ